MSEVKCSGEVKRFSSLIVSTGLRSPRTTGSLPVRHSISEPILVYTISVLTELPHSEHARDPVCQRGVSCAVEGCTLPQWVPPEVWLAREMKVRVSLGRTLV